MAVWSSAAVGSMAGAINAFASGGAMIRFNDSVGSQVAPNLVGSAVFADASGVGGISCRLFVSAVATGSYTLGTAVLLSSASATIGLFTCSTGANDFQFTNLAIASTDSLIVNSWLITVQTA